MLLCALHATIAAPKTTPPNVLLIITDDQGYGDLSLHGNSILKTPNLDRLGRESVRFDRFYVSPNCAPTRAALLTGRYPLRTGVWGVTGRREVMRSEEVTIAEALRAAGYRTGIFGKWHNGAHFPNNPQGQGFDEFFGFAAGHWNNYFDAELEHNGRTVQTRGYISDVLTDAALKFIEKNRRKPFFCYVPYNVPHSPFQVPDRYFDKFKAAGLDDQLASIYGMCANMDDNVGRLLARLDELKLADNTIVIFLTDNGPNGERFNDGMRGRKGSVHEGGCRVPFFVRWPAQLKPALVREIAGYVDVFPTLVELCGVPMSATLPQDGRSLAPLLRAVSKGVPSDWPERMLFTHHVRGATAPQMFPGAVRTQIHRAVYEGGAWQLYDMVADPGQKRDLAREHPQTVEKLSRAYEDWFRDVTRLQTELPPIQVGHRQQSEVWLRAPEALMEGGLRFFAKSGFANDWITGWTNQAARAFWELDVVQSGTYELTLGYLSAPENAGPRIRVTACGSSLQKRLPPAPVKEIKLPHRSGDGNTYVNRHWASLRLGTLRLEKGRTELVIEAVNKPGPEVMDLKHIVLRRVR